MPKVTDVEINQGYRPGSDWEHGLFGELSLAELKELDAIRIVSSLPMGAILFVEQQTPRGIYILCAGKVKLCFTSHAGKTLVLRIAKPGDVLGMEAVLAGLPFEATAEALAPTQVAFIASREFKQFLSRHPSILERLAAHAAFHYDMACKQLQTVGFGRSVVRKIASFLLDRCRGERWRQNGTTLSLGLSHEQIAECLGTTRESVTRSISELRNNGLLEQNGARLIIRDRSALQDFGSRETERHPMNIRSAEEQVLNGGAQDQVASGVLARKPRRPLLQKVS